MSKAKRFPSDYKVGVLGGGQLGKMLALAAANWGLPFHVLDESADFPAGPYCTQFTEGSFQDYETVYQFGKDKDVVTIEIEHVNTAALLQLQKEGVTVHPSPQALTIIKDKGLQKQFYAAQGLATSPFTLYESEAGVLSAIARRKNRLSFCSKVEDGWLRWERRGCDQK
jgi:5-(carboxyamino)imidazole ribonucleotide synthase